MRLSNKFPVGIRFGEFELDSAAFELRKNGSRVQLEPQVFEVLAYLVANPHRIVTRDELAREVWKDDFVGDATLSSRIMAARKAIGDSGSEQRWIKTVHGRGFRFVGASETAPPATLDLVEEAVLKPDLDAAAALLSQLSPAAMDDREGARFALLQGQIIAIREGWSSPAAEASYQESIRRAEGVAATSVFRAARYHLATMYELRGDFARSEALMRAALGPDPEDSESCELLACSLFHQGRFRESLTFAEQGLEADGGPETWRLSAFYGENPRVSCLHWLALSLWFVGRDEEALRHASKAIRLAEDRRQLYALAHARQQSAMLHQLRRDLHLCEHWATATVAIGERQGLRYREAAGKVLLGWSRAMLGQPGSEVLLDEGIASILGQGALMEAPYFQTLVAEAECRRGELRQAANRLDEVIETLQSERGYFCLSETLRLRSEVESRLNPGSDQVQSLLIAARRCAETQGALAMLSRLQSP